MKRRLNLTIDEELYDELQSLPRGVSISEIVSWTFKIIVEEIKLGREMTGKELQTWIDNMPEGKDYRERLTKHYGPKFEKVEDMTKSLKKKFSDLIKK